MLIKISFEKYGQEDSILCQCYASLVKQREKKQATNWTKVLGYWLCIMNDLDNQKGLIVK